MSTRRVKGAADRSRPTCGNAHKETTAGDNGGISLLAHNTSEQAAWDGIVFRRSRRQGRQGAPGPPRGAAPPPPARRRRCRHASGRQGDSSSGACPASALQLPSPQLTPQARGSTRGAPPQLPAEHHHCQPAASASQPAHCSGSPSTAGLQRPPSAKMPLLWPARSARQAACKGSTWVTREIPCVPAASQARSASLAYAGPLALQACLSRSDQAPACPSSPARATTNLSARARWSPPLAE